MQTKNVDPSLFYPGEPNGFGGGDDSCGYTYMTEPRIFDGNCGSTLGYTCQKSMTAIYYSGSTPSKCCLIIQKSFKSCNNFKPLVFFTVFFINFLRYKNC